MDNNLSQTDVGCAQSRRSTWMHSRLTGFNLELVVRCRSRIFATHWQFAGLYEDS